MQSSIAKETLQVFAPLAKLLGMYKIKVDLYLSLNASFLLMLLSSGQFFAHNLHHIVILSLSIVFILNQIHYLRSMHIKKLKMTKSNKAWRLSWFFKMNNIFSGCSLF